MGTVMKPTDNFTAIARGVRIHSGQAALNALPAELDRLSAKNAFVICGRSVADKTTLLARIRSLLGTRFAGCYSNMTKDAPLGRVSEAAEQAKACRADMLIAIGAGSVLKATRIVAILHAEAAPVSELVTQYRDNAPARSPRLQAAKLPIVNVLTAGTSAQNRAGSALKNTEGLPRLEFFDPKTRPAAIFWDSEALASAPTSLAISTGVAVYWRALMSMGAVRAANPLVQGDRRQAFLLADVALDSLADPDNTHARIQICAAALLQNRDEDDGGRPFDLHWIARVVYALAAATFNLVERADQGSTNVILTGPVLKHFGHLCPDAVEEMAAAMGLSENGGKRPEQQADAVAQALDRRLTPLGLPGRLRDLGVLKEQLAKIVTLSLFNFNADRQRQFSQHQDALHAVLHDAW